MRFEIYNKIGIKQQITASLYAWFKLIFVIISQTCLKRLYVLQRVPLQIGYLPFVLSNLSARPKDRISIDGEIQSPSAQVADIPSSEQGVAERFSCRPICHLQGP